MNCELSGESLATAAPGTVVVTPSGHVCRKNLLLTKLTENGNVDPWQPDRPLEEDQLIVLSETATTAASSAKDRIVPPRPLGATSLPSLLQAVHDEYDAVVLELFDTRQALQDCRQELSQALYQNDAALRVIARLKAERDAARQQLQEWQVGEGGEATAAAAAATAGGSNKKRKRDEKISALANAATNDVPETDHQAMVETWTALHQGRRTLMKQLGGSSPTPDKVEEFAKAQNEPVVWNSTAADVVAVHGNQWAMATNDSVKVYEEAKEVASFATTDKATALDVSEDWVAWGNAQGDVQVAKLGGGEGEASVESISIESPIVSVVLHPNKQHILVATQGGQVCVIRLGSSQHQAVAVFTDSTAVAYTTGALHPDGLIFVAGTAQGAICLWDLKSKSLAGTHESDNGAVQSVQVSPNGYHIGVVYADGTTKVWDLRKQKVLATLGVANAKCVAFDDAAKYVLVGTQTNLSIVPAKEWTKAIEFPASNPIAVTWSSEHGIIGAGDKGISCMGKP